MFLISALAGICLSDVESLVLGFVIAFGLAIAFSYVCLILPALLGLVGPAGEALYDAAIVMIFRSVFPGPFFLILLGGFMGNFVGDRWVLR